MTDEFGTENVNRQMFYLNFLISLSLKISVTWFFHRIVLIMIKVKKSLKCVPHFDDGFTSSGFLFFE